MVGDNEYLQEIEVCLKDWDKKLIWWKIYGLIILIFGVPITVYSYMTNPLSGWFMLPFLLMTLFVQIFVSLEILRFNKYAFAFATLLGGPVMWITNGGYLFWLWKYPKVNKVVEELREIERIEEEKKLNLKV